MGTELLRRGIVTLPCLEMANLHYPELVASIHAEYIAAGAEILTTNTFGANQFRLGRHRLSARQRELNLAGARLARQAAGEALVAGSIGPSGEHRNRPASQRLFAAFREQAAALLEGGVDLFSCETFGDVEELRVAVTAIRDVSDRPIVAQMTFTSLGTTPLGLSPAAVAAAMSDAPIVALGVNCARGWGTAERVVAELKHATDIPLAAHPNAGEPIKTNGALVYPIGPAEFAAMAVRLAPHVCILGGCCGTTPEYIAALRRSLLR